MPTVKQGRYQTLVTRSQQSKIVREKGTVPLPRLIHSFITNATGTPQFSLLPTLDTVKEVTAHPCTSREVLARPVSRLLQLNNGELSILDKIHGVLVCFIFVVVIHGKLVLVGDSDMELFIFVQEPEELVAKDSLVSVLVGMDNKILKVFDELHILGISEIMERERRRRTALLWPVIGLSIVIVSIRSGNTMVIRDF